ncbi:unnamed protein product [Lepidochelys kempii]
MVYQQQCKQTCLPPPCCVTKCTTKCLDPCCKVCVTKCVTKCVDPCCKVCVKKCTTCVHPCPCPCPENSAPQVGILEGTCQGTGTGMDAPGPQGSKNQVSPGRVLPTSWKMVYQQQCKQTCLPPPCCVTKCTTKCLDPCCKVCVTKCVTKCVDPCCKVCVKKCTTCVHPCPCPCPEKCIPCPENSAPQVGILEGTCQGTGTGMDAFASFSEASGTAHLQREDSGLDGSLS